MAAPQPPSDADGTFALHPEVTPEWVAAQEGDDGVIPLIQQSAPSLIWIHHFGRAAAGRVIASRRRRRGLRRTRPAPCRGVGWRASAAMYNAECSMPPESNRERAEEAAVLRRLVRDRGARPSQPSCAIMMAAGCCISRQLATGDRRLSTGFEQREPDEAHAQSDSRLRQFTIRKR